jgi:hypothetical protein
MTNDDVRSEIGEQNIIFYQNGPSRLGERLGRNRRKKPRKPKNVPNHPTTPPSVEEAEKLRIDEL